jgi:N-sulfoglucosamine sulfohydrolase
MNRLLKGLACLLALTAQLAIGAQRNVLLIVSDDQGRDLGAYGSGVRTPNIDALAAKGTLFTEAFATVSSCSPSRAVIYSGLYSHSNGMYGLAHDVHNQHFLPWVKTLPQLLKSAGYATALVGKKHILPDAALPFDAELAPEQAGNRDVAHMASEMKRFIDASNDKPFFVIVGFSDPHRAPQNFGNTQTWPQTTRAPYDAAKLTVPAHLPDLPEVRQDLAEYYESVSRLDSGIGLLLEAIKSSGHAEDTLVIYLSDNGRPFPRAKTTLYDTGIHLPLVISSPAQRQRGILNEAMVSWIDIAPTILDWTGAKASADYQLPGRSLLPILDRQRPAGWDRVFASHGFHEIHQYYPMRALRTRQYKYILNLAHQLPFPIAGDVASSPSWQAVQKQKSPRLGDVPLEAFLQRPREELYDLTQDPTESKNVVDDSEHSAALASLRKELQQFRRATKDPWLGEASIFEHERH